MRSAASCRSRDVAAGAALPNGPGGRRTRLLGRLARSTVPPGDRWGDRLPHDGLPRRSHHVHLAEAEDARSDARLRQGLRPLMERILPLLVERRIKVTANAGGVNPRACADAVAGAARRLGLAGKLRLGVVTGDDLLARLDGLLARGHELKNLDTGRPLRDVRD